MTEAGKKWVYEQTKPIEIDDYKQAHALSQRSAEFWLRAFCDAVEEQASRIDGGGAHRLIDLAREEAIGQAFDELKRELLARREMKPEHERAREIGERLGEMDERQLALQGLADALRVLYEETIDYITINHLGDPHHNQSMKQARAALDAAKPFLESK